MTQIAPLLAVTEGNAAVEFYENAFGAKLLWKLERKRLSPGCRSAATSSFSRTKRRSVGSEGRRRQVLPPLV